VIGGSAWLALRAAARMLRQTIEWPRLALTLAPLGAAVLFVGLSQMTLSQLRAEGLQPPGVQALRALLFIGASLWSLWLAHRVTAQSQQPLWRRALTCALIALPIVLVDLSWWRHFHGS
jgi:cytochrome bd-type quinol oxidase subunit 2